MKFVLMCVLCVLCLISQTCWAKNQGYFECFQLNPAQIAWFRNDPVKSCCALSDGMPIRYEQRADGYYVPPYPKALFEAQQCKAGKPWQENEDHANEDRHDWIRVPVPPLKTKNMVGVGIVWWTTGDAEEGGNYEYKINCAIFGVLT